MTAREKAEAMGWSVDPGRYDLKGEVIQSEIRKWNRESLERLRKALDKESGGGVTLAPTTS